MIYVLLSIVTMAIPHSKLLDTFGNNNHHQLQLTLSTLSVISASNNIRWSTLHLIFILHSGRSGNSNK
jgi:hypothetical protein